MTTSNDKDFQTLAARAALLGLTMKENFTISSRSSCRHCATLEEAARYLDDQEARKNYDDTKK